MKKFGMFQQGMLAACLLGMMACSPSIGDDFMNDIPGDFPGEMPGGGGAGTSSNDGTPPDFDATISDWDGEMADDAALDVVGSNADFYHEANEFTSTVTVTYKGNSASVVSSNDQILHHTSGAYVTLDMETHSMSGVQIIVKGQSEDGGLKIYGEKKFKLTLDGVELTSKKGPAINSQCKKRMFVHLNAGTTNRLTDTGTYSDDAYYLDASADEDRKGCFFSEGNLVFSGTGVLVVAGKYKHAIVTDGYFWMRPSVTLVVTEAAKNGIHVKGDEDD